MRGFLWLVFAGGLCGCGGGDQAGPGDGANADMAPCYLASGISVKGPPIPGRAVELGLSDAGSQRSYEVRWTVSSGTLSSETGAPVTWTIPTSLAANVAEEVQIVAEVTAPGCEPESLHKAVPVDWPAPLRTIVIHNRAVPGSTDVAKYYAAFRQIPDDHLCALDYRDPTTVAAADFDALLGSVLDCVDAVGPHAQYLVPVFGVPYKLAGRIADSLAHKGVTTVCLDAVLAFGRAAKTMRAAETNPYYQAGDSPQGIYPDHVPIGAFRATLGEDYYLVARIDGADAEAAKALVDRTRAAEELAARGPLPGTVYVDGKMGLPHPTTASFGSYEDGEWHIIGVENVFQRFDPQHDAHPIVADYNAAEFGTAPAPLACPDALYYAGWYSYGHYNDAFTWKTGAIGGHLDSCSACDLRGATDWSAMALRRGITATFGAVNEPYVAGMPSYDQFFRYLLQGATFGEAGYESTYAGAWMMVWVGDPLYRPYAPR